MHIYRRRLFNNINDHLIMKHVVKHEMTSFNNLLLYSTISTCTCICRLPDSLLCVDQSHDRFLSMTRSFPVCSWQVGDVGVSIDLTQTIFMEKQAHTRPHHRIYTCSFTHCTYIYVPYISLYQPGRSVSMTWPDVAAKLTCCYVRLRWWGSESRTQRSCSELPANQSAASGSGQVPGQLSVWWT